MLFCNCVCCSRSQAGARLRQEGSHGAGGKEDSGRGAGVWRLQAAWDVSLTCTKSTAGHMCLALGQGSFEWHSRMQRTGAAPMRQWDTEMRNKADTHLRCFPAVGHADADAKMLISLANSTLYIREIKRVLVTSISFKQHTSLFLMTWSMENCFHASKRLFQSVENKINKGWRKPKWTTKQ